MKTILYNPIFINPQAYYVFPRLTRYLQPDNESTAEPANYIGTIEVKVIAYGDTTLKRTYTNTDSIYLSEFKNTWIRISLFTKVGSCVLGEWKIGNMESDLPYIDPEVLASLKVVVIVGNKTNNDSDRAIVKNLVDPDNPFVISNAAYTEGSGYADKGSPYYGAFVTDGIDDLITSTKTAEEMGITDEVTVVSMIHQINANKNFTTTNNLRNENRVIGRNTVTNIGKTGIYGWYKKDIQGTTATLIDNILGDKNDYTGHYTESTNSVANSKFYVTGYAVENGFTELSSVAWYWTIIANKVLTTDQINQVIAYFNLDRTLKPDILCNVKKQGITNENHAEFGDRLIDFSGNGRDIQLNNLAWKGGSGIAAKQYETFKDWTNTPYQTSTVTEIDEFTRVVDSTSNAYWVSMINRTSDFDKVHDSINIVLYQDDMLLVHECKYKIDENVTTKALYETLKSGVNTITLATIDKFTDIPEDAEIMSLGEWVNPKSNKGSVKITLLPSYEGGVLLDGINDFGKVTGMPIYKDYTVIAKYQRLTQQYVSGIGGTCLISKSHTPNQGSFIIDAGSSSFVKTQCYSFGALSSTLVIDNSISCFHYQTKYIFDKQTINTGEGIDSDTLWLGTFRDNDQRFFNGAIYSLMSFPYSMSEFLIERQLKKHKLGTLYPDMVEFRPVINSNVLLDSKPTFVIRGTSTHLNAGDYVPENSQIWVSIKMNNIADRITKFTVNGKTIDIPENAYSEVTLQYGFPFVIDKSPQKIGITIEQDENYVLFNPVITSNVEYHRLDFYLNNYQKIINIGDYIPKDAYLRANIYLNNNVDELTAFIFNGVNIGYRRSSVDDTAFNISHIYNYDSPQEVNITIDEYIRYEDIVQPYPVLLRFNDENGNEVSWGGKFRVGSTITRIGSAADSNLLPNIYNIFGLLLNDNQVTSSKVIVEKTMVFKAKSAYIFDNNEPNCILSPRLLRIPNSSYKILGYIPDISGHGNHGILHNSAYIEGSGVNEDGSYQFDGVDDFVTIPTVTGGGKQVLMKVNNNTINSMLYDQRSSGASPNSLNSDFTIYNTNTVDNNLIAYQSRLVGKTYIDGILNTNITCEDLLGVLHNITITCDTVAPNNGVVPNIGRGGVLKDLYSNMALYDFMLFDNISTDDKIKELNEYVGIEAKVELPPYYWDAYGKTNLDVDKATIQQRGVAEGDYDLTNYNHAYDKMSGYGGYNLGRFDKSWASSSSSNTSIKVVQRNPYDITLKKLGGNSDWEFNNTELKVISNPVSVKFKSNKNIRVTCDYHYYPVGGNSEGTPLGITSKDLIANKDAIITISPISQENIDKYNIDVNRGYYLIYFQLSSTLAVNEEVTIEMLPLYPNGLVYDGVTDYSENANIPALTDYTYIFKRDILGFNPRSVSMHKGTSTNAGRAFTSDYDYGETNEVLAYSFGSNIATPNATSKKIIYGTKTSVDGQPITPGSNIDDAGLFIGKWYDDFFKKMVFYKLILYPKTIPLLQINFLKNLMERDEIIDLNNKIFIQE